MKAWSIAFCAILVSAVLLPLVQTSQAAGPPYSWSGPTPIDNYTGFGVGDVLPTALQSSNGTLWLAWQSDLNDLAGGISYKTMNSTGFWTSAQQLTIGTLPNISPYLAQLRNGTVIIFWALRAVKNYNIYYKRYVSPSNTWSPSVKLTTSSLNDTDPAGAVGADGTLWLFWQRSNKTCSSCLEDRQLYYKTLAGGVWSSDVKVTSDANWNWGPSAMVGKDGKVRVVYSKGSGVAGTFNLYTKVYNGISWGSETCISAVSACSSPVNSDEHPSLLQDRNGTLWLFWGRQASTSNAFYYILFDRFSVDNGQTWSSEAQVSSEAAPTTSQTPALVQTNSGSDKSIRAFYISDRMNAGGFLQIWDYVSPNISPVHDVKVSFVTPSTTLEYPGGMASVGMSAIVTITVTVLNLGDSLENNLQVSVTLSNTTSYPLPTQSGSISLGGSLILSFNWNTTNVTPARYTLSVSAVLASGGETVGNAGDNSWSQKNGVHIIPYGDVDQNGQVSITDVSVFIFGFGAAPGNPRWNPFCDINNSGIIDIIDVGVAVHNFGVVT